MSELHVRLKHRFDERFTLDVTLEVPPGITVLKGPSGSGKTSTLHAIAGLFRADTSSIRFGDVEWSALAPERRNVSLVFQSLALFPHLTARENVRFNTTDALATEWLERMKVGHVAARKPRSLSGGEAQRIALARAFARQPSVVLLDEPFSALDDALRIELLGELSTHIARLGLPTLLVTHDARDIEALDARVITLANGSIAPLQHQLGPTER